MNKEVSKQLELEEARVHYAYPDHLGFITVGIGRMIDRRKGGFLRDSEIDFMLSNDILMLSEELLHDYPWMKVISKPRFDALLQMRFQLGKVGLSKFTGTLASMRAGNWAAAAKGMQNSLWAKQTPGRVGRLVEQVILNKHVYKED